MTSMGSLFNAQCIQTVDYFCYWASLNSSFSDHHLTNKACLTLNGIFVRYFVSWSCCWLLFLTTIGRGEGGHILWYNYSHKLPELLQIALFIHCGPILPPTSLSFFFFSTDFLKMSKANLFQLLWDLNHLQPDTWGLKFVSYLKDVTPSPPPSARG